MKGEIVRKARLKVSGLGCESCVAPSKALFLKVRGVHAVHVLGSVVEVIYDESMTTIEEVLEKSGVRSYYQVATLSDEPVEEEGGRLAHTLSLRITAKS